MEKTHYKVAEKDMVPFNQKIAFGSGHLANQLFPAALGVFMIVLVLSLKMNPALAGLLAAIPRILDAVLDPIMGFVSDNTVSKWGRRKPYIFLVPSRSEIGLASKPKHSNATWPTKN